MPMPVMPWQHLLPFSDSTADESDSVAPVPEADNSSIMNIHDPAERAEAIARALAAGVKGADPKQLARSVFDGLRGDDI